MANNALDSYELEVVPRYRYNAVLIGAEGEAGRLLQQRILGHENWWSRIQLLRHVTALTDWQAMRDQYDATTTGLNGSAEATATYLSKQKTILANTHLFFVDDTAPERSAATMLSGIEVIKSLEEMKIAQPLGQLLATQTCVQRGIIIGCAQRPSEAFSKLLGDSNILLESDVTVVAADEILENALRLLPLEPAESNF